MLKIYRHITDVSQIIRGTIIVPGGIKKLVGVGVFGDTTLNRNRESTTQNAYRIRLIINNKEVNVLDYPFNDAYATVYDNVNEDKRLLTCNNNVRPQSTINYIVNVPNIGNDKAVKVYLKFE